MKSQQSYRKGKRFINPHAQVLRRRWYHMVLWALGYYRDPEPTDHAYVPGFVFPNEEKEPVSEAPQVQWINHSTFLVSVEGVHWLTDPIWSDRCSPFSLMGPHRFYPAPLALEALPALDYVFISHNHYDHLDKPTIRRLYQLQPQISWFVPLGLKRWFAKLGMTRIYELDWWQEHACAPLPSGATVQITALPSQHFSGRTIIDYNRIWRDFKGRVAAV